MYVCFYIYIYIYILSWAALGSRAGFSLPLALPLPLPLSLPSLFVPYLPSLFVPYLPSLFVPYLFICPLALALPLPLSLPRELRAVSFVYMSLSICCILNLSLYIYIYIYISLTIIYPYSYFVCAVFCALSAFVLAWGISRAWTLIFCLRCFLRGPVVSANLRGICLSSCQGKRQSPQIFAILPQRLSRKILNPRKHAIRVNKYIKQSKENDEILGNRVKILGRM